MWFWMSIFRHSKYAYMALYSSLFILYNAYWIGCIVWHVREDLEFDWCRGIGFLSILTIITYLGKQFLNNIAMVLWKSAKSRLVKFPMRQKSSLSNHLFSEFMIRRMTNFPICWFTICQIAFMFFFTKFIVRYSSNCIVDNFYGICNSLSY